ncbi:uncharacterized protein [Anoplolepis gracilipes]|uniref:uncharacterized protein n=1 Tax=Anoplolepis gracilipes TaxID=354296 RepID=UPI003BA17D2B
MNIEYFNLNKILLLLIGLWPYKQSYFTRFQFIFLSSILTTNLIVQIKDSLDQLLHIYNEIRDNNEIAIMTKCGYNGKTCYLGVCTVFFGISIVLFWPQISNVTLPTNASRLYPLLITTEYFIDQEKYYYFIMFHFYTIACIQGLVIIGTGSILVMYWEHIVGLFKIASTTQTFCIERAMNIDMLQNINQNHTLICKGLICAVNIHLQAMNLTYYFLSNLETMMFCLVIFTVGSVSFNLFRIFQIVSSKENIVDLLYLSICATTTILYIFIDNYLDECVTNNSDDIFTSAYSVRWYVAPLYIQKMILFLLQRNSIVFALKTGGVFVASMQCFASV